MKSGTIVHSTIVPAPTSGMTTRASSSEARSDPSSEATADDREREVDDAGDDADRLGAAAAEEVSQQEELQSEEVRNHDEALHLGAAADELDEALLEGAAAAHVVDGARRRAPARRR